MPDQDKIAVVGAGLVGSLLSIYLLKRGYQVELFERRGDMRKSGGERGRSINLALSNRGLRALREVGLAEKLTTIALPMHGRMMHDQQAKTTFLPYGKGGQYINSISRSALNISLMDEAERLGVRIHFEHRLDQVDHIDSTLTFQHAKTHGPYRMIIGADGAFSAVRHTLQFVDRFNLSQDYIEHGYKELHIPAGPQNNFRLEPGALHIWPRESFMLIALPNPDKTFTCTLFFPFDGTISFSTVTDEGSAAGLFKSVFPDAYQLMPDFAKQWRENPVASLVTVKCDPWNHRNVLLIGDAAHAIVPFFGQGMNAGFEDCRILNELLDKHSGDWANVTKLFTSTRKPDADAIARLALDNFVEMRDLVADPEFLLRKKIEAKLNALYPEQWIPLYSMVTFYDSIRYSEAYKIGQQQRAIMDKVMKTPQIAHRWESLDFSEIVRALPRRPAT